jgi:hypothetical protein
VSVPPRRVRIGAPTTRRDTAHRPPARHRAATTRRDTRSTRVTVPREPFETHAASGTADVLVVDIHGRRRVGLPFEQLTAKRLAEDIRALNAEA